MLNETMAHVTEERLSLPNEGGNIHLICRDALPLPYPESSFDVIFLSHSLEAFDTPEIPEVLAHCYRVLKSGGRICVIALAKRRKEGLGVKLFEWLHEKLPAVVDCRFIYVRDLLMEAGFKIEQVQEWTSFTCPIDIVLAKK